jgi:hypothetical protein
MPLRLEHEAHPESARRWRWAVWLEGSDAELERVDHVEYLLHPTFPEPVQVRRNRQNKFRLEATGWGEFTISARIRHKEGTEAVMRHLVRLGERAPRKHPVVFLSHSTVDAPFVTALQDALRHQHVVTRDAGDVVTAGGFWEDDLEDALRSSDAVLAFVSGRESAWVGREIDAARRLGVPVIPVALGDQAPTSERIAGVQSIVVSGEDDVELSAREISNSLHRLFAEREAAGF